MNLEILDKSFATILEKIFIVGDYCCGTFFSLGLFSALFGLMFLLRLIREKEK